MIKVLVVEDSPVLREFLVYVLSADPDILIVGTASDGAMAVEAARRLRPDVITMDIHMPRMDGLEATRRIMESAPTPIVILSGSVDKHEALSIFQAIDAGALTALPRPAGMGAAEHEAMVQKLRQTVKLMAEVKVVRHWPHHFRETSEPGMPPFMPRAIAIGASIGGPQVLRKIVAMLPRDLPAPLLIVQHMTAGFIDSFADWLAQFSLLPVEVARHGERVDPGRIYVAPSGHQMRIGHGGVVQLDKEAGEYGLSPSVSPLFRSLADIYGGAVIAGLLSGMGNDGALELRLLRERGAFTFVQDADSSVVNGMPGEAVRLGAAMYVLSPEKIGALLAGLPAQARDGKADDGDGN